jgi:hypothetical protein
MRRQKVRTAQQNVKAGSACPMSGQPILVTAAINRALPSATNLPHGLAQPLHDRRRPILVGWAKALLRRAHHSLTERPGNLFHIPTPIGRQQAPFNVAMKAAVRPISDTGDVAVLDRIEVNVVNVPLKVGIIANGVFPIATLPNALLAFAHFAL